MSYLHKYLYLHMSNESIDFEVKSISLLGHGKNHIPYFDAFNHINGILLNKFKFLNNLF